MLRETLKSIPSVISTRTTVVLQTVKETTALPLNKCGLPPAEKAKAKRR
jgi:hypothetical protein